MTVYLDYRIADKIASAHKLRMGQTSFTNTETFNADG